MPASPYLYPSRRLATPRRPRRPTPRLAADDLHPRTPEAHLVRGTSSFPFNSPSPPLVRPLPVRSPDHRLTIAPTRRRPRRFDAHNRRRAGRACTLKRSPDPTLFWATLAPLPTRPTTPKNAPRNEHTRPETETNVAVLNDVRHSPHSLEPDLHFQYEVRWTPDGGGTVDEFWCSRDELIGPMRAALHTSKPMAPAPTRRLSTTM